MDSIKPIWQTKTDPGAAGRKEGPKPFNFVCKATAVSLNGQYVCRIVLGAWILALCVIVQPVGAQVTSEIAKQVQNPIASLISAPFENGFNPQTGIDKQESYILEMKPVVPFTLSNDWNPITRTIIPVIQVPDLSPVLRRNDPFVSQSVGHKNATNGDIYPVGSKLFVFGNKFAFLLTGGVRGTNAEKYGYGGNTLNWQARAFGGIAFPIPIKRFVVVSLIIEIDQEPEKIKYVPTAPLPTDLIYAVTISHALDSRFSFDIGTGHVCATLGLGINIKVNNAIAFAADFRF